MKLAYVPAFAVAFSATAFADPSADDAFRQAQAQHDQAEKSAEQNSQARKDAIEKANTAKMRAALASGTVARMGAVATSTGTPKDNGNDTNFTVDVVLKDGRACQLEMDLSADPFGSYNVDSSVNIKAFENELPYLKAIMPAHTYEDFAKTQSVYHGLFGSVAEAGLQYASANMNVGDDTNFYQWHVSADCYKNGKESQGAFSAVSFGGTARVYPENQELVQVDQASDQDSADSQAEAERHLQWQQQHHK